MESGNNKCINCKNYSEGFFCKDCLNKLNQG